MITLTTNDFFFLSYECFIRFLVVHAVFVHNMILSSDSLVEDLVYMMTMVDVPITVVSFLMIQ